MAPLPRARCPVCDRDVALRKGGELREHHPDSWSSLVCPASGYLVDRAEQARADLWDQLLEAAVGS